MASLDEAKQHEHSQWDPEHILITLLEQQEGVIAALLHEIGADVPRIYVRVRQDLDDLPKLTGDTVGIYQTPRMIQLLFTAEEEAERLQDEAISTEHLLIALTAKIQDAAGSLLFEFGVTNKSVHQALQKVRGDR